MHTLENLQNYNLKQLRKTQQGQRYLLSISKYNIMNLYANQFDNIQ